LQKRENFLLSKSEDKTFAGKSTEKYFFFGWKRISTDIGVHVLKRFFTVHRVKNKAVWNRDQAYLICSIEKDTAAQTGN